VVAAVALAWQAGRVVGGEGPANEAEKGGADKPSPSADAVKTVGLGMELADMGRATKDPVLLCAAAHLLRSAPTTPSDAKPSTMKGEKSEGGGGEAGPAYEPDGLLAEAKAAAGGNKVYTDLADAIGSTRPKGVVGGPKKAVTTIAGHASDLYIETFAGGEVAAVLVKGDGNSDLDLFVYDENGNLIIYDDSKGDEAYCEWVPKWTGPFQLKVKNAGGAGVAYGIITN
jgi:hypothetical protein